MQFCSVLKILLFFALVAVRLLSVAAESVRAAPDTALIMNVRSMDFLLVCCGALQAVLWLPMPAALPDATRRFRCAIAGQLSDRTGWLVPSSTYRFSLQRIRRRCIGLRRCAKMPSLPRDAQN